jgi:hypothetical protein
MTALPNIISNLTLKGLIKPIATASRHNALQLSNINAVHPVLDMDFPFKRSIGCNAHRQTMTLGTPDPR